MANRKCFVPICKNDSLNSPNKMFVRIREDLRGKWCREVNATYHKANTMYCCEDHFDPQEALKNYYKYKLMGEEPLFKPTAILRNTTMIPLSKEPVLKPTAKLQTTTMNPLKETSYISQDSELRKLLMLPEISQPPVKKRKSEDNIMPNLHGIEEKSQNTPKSAEKSIQVDLKFNFRNKAIQTGTNVVSQGISTMKTICRTVSTSPIRIEDSHTSDFETEDDKEDDHKDGKNDETDTLPEEIPDVKPKLESLKDLTNDTPLPDLHPGQNIFEDEFDHFGKNLAKQLRNLPLLVALEMQQMLLYVLKKQQLKVLNSFSTFSLDPLSNN